MQTVGEIRVRRRWWKWPLRLLLLVLVVYIVPVGYQLGTWYYSEGREFSWSGLRRDSSQQAPDPATTPEAVIQVYAARAVSWRGAVGVHTWIATKAASEDFYNRIEVMGYALRWSGESVRIRRGQPDGYWFGSRPILLREIRGGKRVDDLINVLHEAAVSYPFNQRYVVWPGPNSNSFIAHLARLVPELKLELPANAVGKDYLARDRILAKAPSGSGFQLSLGGLFGLILALEEGIELNILGLTAGIDFSPFAIKLPAVGRIGFSDFQRAEFP